MSVNVVTSVTAMVSPILDDLGLELYDMEFAGGVLKVTIDTPAGQEAGVDIDQISRVNRLLGRELDHNDVVPGRYTLEVTSPGLERTLRLPRHFVREVGKTIAVRLSSALDGQRRIQGDLVSASEDTIVVRLTDNALTEVTIPLSIVERAKTVFQWGPTPKPGSTGAATKSKKSTSRPTNEESDDDDTDTEMEVDAL